MSETISKTANWIKFKDVKMLDDEYSRSVTKLRKDTVYDLYAATFNSRALNKEDFSKLMKTVLPKVKKKLQRSYWNGLKGDRDSSGAEGLNKDMAMGGL